MDNGLPTLVTVSECPRGNRYFQQLYSRQPNHNMFRNLCFEKLPYGVEITLPTEWGGMILQRINADRFEPILEWLSEQNIRWNIRSNVPRTVGPVDFVFMFENNVVATEFSLKWV